MWLGDRVLLPLVWLVRECVSECVGVRVGVGLGWVSVEVGG